METNHNIVNANISSSSVYMGSGIMDGGTTKNNGIWTRGGCRCYCLRHGLMQKTLIPLNPQIENHKRQIWQLGTYLEGSMFEGISNCDLKTCPNNLWDLDRDCA